MLFSTCLNRDDDSWDRQETKLTGKVAIVTGGNRGIGFEVVKDFGIRGATVIIACRTLKNAVDTKIRLIRELGFHIDASHFIPMEINLSSLASIQQFASNIRAQFRQIHLLINNAGVCFNKKPRTMTADGLEINFGVNYVAPFFLTKLLLDLLMREGGRVIVVSSSLHQNGEIVLNDLNNERNKTKRSLYANSKLALSYFAYELAKRTKGSNVSVYNCIPGWVYTGFFENTLKWYHYLILGPTALFYIRSPRKGAQTIIYCATNPELQSETGLMYKDCKHYVTFVAFSDSISKQLWDITEDVIDVIVNKYYADYNKL